MTSNSAKPVGRYAPSPTGALHLGNLRTALAACGFTRSRGGKFLLRVEDIDEPRVRNGAEARQLQDLCALGIEWDEEPWRQSERSAIYREYLDRLRADGKIYPCFCSRKDIQAALSAPHREDEAQGYPGLCADLDAATVEERQNRGDQHAWRLRVAHAEKLFHDEFAGEVPVDLPREGGDFVVHRADGLFAYQFVCALDDALSGVTEVLRGEDLLDSGARQQFILQTLGIAPPAYWHIPLMHGPDGKRLSKRDGADDLSYFLLHGADETAVRSYLAWTLGQCEKRERLEMKEFVNRFDITKVPHNAVTYESSDLREFCL